MRLSASAPETGAVETAATAAAGAEETATTAVDETATAAAEEVSTAATAAVEIAGAGAPTFASSTRIRPSCAGLGISARALASDTSASLSLPSMNFIDR